MATIEICQTPATEIMTRKVSFARLRRITSRVSRITAKLRSSHRQSCGESISLAPMEPPDKSTSMSPIDPSNEITTMSPIEPFNQTISRLLDQKKTHLLIRSALVERELVTAKALTEKAQKRYVRHISELQDEERRKLPVRIYRPSPLNPNWKPDITSCAARCEPSAGNCEQEFQNESAATLLRIWHDNLALRKIKVAELEVLRVRTHREKYFRWKFQNSGGMEECGRLATKKFEDVEHI